ncbi:hypothetical protein RQM59_01090 [Flavobacteriaceae bacterium S356]|uniref:Lipoprotein n=1 Tax=Asprobacillus argus TaxID=3076534 RepID=A0ABU3LD04_9FLAO|nr:hypothetical protein [Flavobacteriaceae bacterium S356]
MKIVRKISSLVAILLLAAACTTNNQNTSDCETECSYTLASGETAGTVPTSIEGTYNLTYSFAQTGSPYTDGTTATFTLINNELTVEIEGHDCITLKNPVLIGTNNYKFKDDCRDNIAFNVSPNNNGTFNEINVEPLGQGWLGQFHE